MSTPENHRNITRECLARVNVVGASGSGKSTFAKRLAERLGQPYIEMDAIFWEPNWCQPTDEVFFARLTAAIDQSTWVLDGNYDRTLELKWRNATAVVWLDTSFTRNLLRSLRRAFERMITRKELWPGTGNRESFTRAFLSRDSVLLWMLKTHGKVRRRYSERMNDSRYGHIRFIRIRSPREAEALLRAIDDLSVSVGAD